MALGINTNLMAFGAQRGLSAANSRQAESVQRLSTGLRINSAADDAAGLAISERLLAQVRGTGAALRNVNDGISLMQTAEGTIGAISGSLQRIREIAVQAANGTLSSSDRQTMQLEVDQLFQGCLSSQNQTQFNKKPLFDGNFTSQSIQVGANAGDEVLVSLPELFVPVPVTTPGYTIPAVTQDVTTVVSTPTARVVYGGTAVSQALSAGDLTINGTPIQPSVVGPSPWQSADSAWAIKNAITSSGVPGVTTLLISCCEKYCVQSGQCRWLHPRRRHLHQWLCYSGCHWSDHAGPDG